MSKQLIEQFNEVRQEKRNQEKLQSEYANLKQLLGKKTRQIDKAREILKKEFKEYKDMEKLSLTSIFHTLLGNKEEKLEKEREEYLLAKVKYDSLKDEIELIENQLEKVDGALKNITSVDEEYQRLFKAKEELILGTNDELAGQLNRMAEEVGRNRIQKNEAIEAYKAGEKVLVELDQIGKVLNSAHNWGVADALGGGMLGLLATSQKHSKIDEVKRMASRTQYSINRFIKELKDVDIDLQIDRLIEIGEMLTFADYFFGGLIADIMVQQKIQESQRRLASVARRITLILTRLKEEIRRVNSNIQQLEEKRVELVEQ
ncbi:hypothetical protein EMN47_16490 [Prolixibacteraceae bacterium JC049]|nr:hypothetical protein [Prolixibacteraceae bacterium JC049]